MSFSIRLKFVIIWTLMYLAFNISHAAEAWDPDGLIYRSAGFDTGNCTTLESWSGAWSRGDMSDEAAHVLINKTGMSFEHNLVYICVKSLEDNYVIREEDGISPPCYRCLIILRRHYNVLQYRESECDDQATFDDCMTMSPSSPVLSLFRVDFKTEPCPFAERRMKFDYSIDGRTCPYEAPAGSNVEACSAAGTVLMNYEACVDVQGSEKMREELTCVGSWQENSHNYFIGKVIRRNVGGHKEEGFKCFNFQEIRRHKTSQDVIGYQVARSGDTGSCAHAVSPTDGSLTYKLLVQEEKFVSFPFWLGPDPDEHGESRWNALNLTFQFVVNAVGGKIQVVPTLIDAASQAMNTASIRSYQFTASRIDNLTSAYAAIDVIEIVGCKRLPICMDLYRRDENVIEIELYHRTPESDRTTSCHHLVKVNPHITYTLVKDRPNPVSCPLTGVFKLDVPPVSSHEQHIEKCDNSTSTTAAILENTELDHFLEIGCGGEHLSDLDFYTSCRNGKPILPGEALQLVSGLDCISSWKEDQKTFIVANNSRFGVPGYRCLEFLPNQEHSTYSVFVSMDDCKPSSDQRLINWTFSAAQYSECGYTNTKANMQMSAAAPLILDGFGFILALPLLVGATLPKLFLSVVT